MGRTSSGKIVGLINPGGSGGVEVGRRERGRERWALTFTFVAWKPAGGELVAEPLRCRMPTSVRSLKGWMERLQPYSIIEVEAGRKGSDGATILKRIIRVGVEDAELDGVAAAQKKPIVLVHPALGRFKYARRYGWYEGKLGWDGRKVDVCLSCADPERPGPAIVAAERLHADQVDWKRRVDDLMVQTILPRWNDDWRPEEEPTLTREEFLSKAVLDSIDVDGEGRVSFWHSDGDLLGGHSIVVHGDIDRGPTGVDMPG